MADIRRPVAVPSWLRSSTAVSESKPRSWNDLAGSTRSVVVCPRTAATWPRTSSVTRSARSASPSLPRRWAMPADVPDTAEAVRRVVVRTRPRSTADTSPRARSAGRSRRTGTSDGSPPASAASNRARPCSSDSGRVPLRARRCLLAWPRAPVMPASGVHGPQARDRPGSPEAARARASASRNALPAA